MARLLLLLPTASYRAADFLAAARALGAEVVVASERRLVSMGDNQLTLDLRRPEAAAEAIAALAEERPLDAVVAVDDQGVRVAALAAERLGLSGNPPEAAAATRDKAAMRRALAAAGVPQPEHRTVGPSDDSAAVAAEVGLPCVVKPLSLSASRGVIRADDPEAAAAAAARVRAILAEAGEDPEGPLLIERYVPGAEVAVEGLLRAGSLEPLAVFDKPDPLEGPYFEETIFTTPSRLPAEVVAAVDSHDRGCLRGARAARGPRPRGAAHRRRARVDARARRALDRRAVLALASLRRRCEPRGADPAPRARAAARRPPPRGGGVGRDDAADPPRGRTAGGARPGRGTRRAGHRAGSRSRSRRDRPVRPLPEGDRYLGFLFARGETPEQVERTLRTAHGQLEIVIGEPSE